MLTLISGEGGDSKWNKTKLLWFGDRDPSHFRSPSLCSLRGRVRRHKMVATFLYVHAYSSNAPPCDFNMQVRT
jgi:hypothetical protein